MKIFNVPPDLGATVVAAGVVVAGLVVTGAVVEAGVGFQYKGWHFHRRSDHSLMEEKG